MPTVTETPIKAYAHCTNPRCSGNAQVEVEAVLAVTAWAYHETGGDGMFSHPERSTEQPRFRDPASEGVCEHCGSNRDLSLARRMQLDDSGFDASALLEIEPGAQYDPDTAGEVAARLKDEEHEREMSGLREQMAEMRGIMLGQQSKPVEEPLAHEADIEYPKGE